MAPPEADQDLYAEMAELARQNLDLAVELRATAKRLQEGDPEEEGGSDDDRP